MGSGENGQELQELQEFRSCRIGEANSGVRIQESELESDAIWAEF
jgi:hypothetical protein